MKIQGSRSEDNTDWFWNSICVHKILTIKFFFQGTIVFVENCCLFPLVHSLFCSLVINFPRTECSSNWSTTMDNVKNDESSLLQSLHCFNSLTSFAPFVFFWLALIAFPCRDHHCCAKRQDAVVNFRNRRLTEKIKQESWWQRQFRKALSDEIKIIWLLINVSVRRVENLVFMARLFRREHQITVK